MWQQYAHDLIRLWASDRKQPTPLEYDVELPDEVIECLRTRKIDSLYYLLKPQLSPLQQMYDEAWNIQKSSVRQLVSTFEGENIDVLVLKGCELTSALLSGHALSGMVDCDLLLRRPDVNRARATMFEAGFRQIRTIPVAGRFLDADISEIAETESRHYELFPFSKLVPLEIPSFDPSIMCRGVYDPVFIIDGSVYLRLSIDLHHAVATDVQSDQFFDRSVPSSLGIGKTLSPTDHLWFTTSRYYNEIALHGKRSLRDLAFIGMVLRRMPIDWSLIISIANEYDFRPSLYYLLTYISRLASSPIPNSILEELSPTRGSRQRDWGWQLGVLFDSIEPMPTVCVVGAT
jgi:hypothetical protein